MRLNEAIVLMGTQCSGVFECSAHMNLRELVVFESHSDKTIDALVIRQVGVGKVEFHCNAESNQPKKEPLESAWSRTLAHCPEFFLGIIA